jgi:hypothetical protein
MLKSKKSIAKQAKIVRVSLRLVFIREGATAKALKVQSMTTHAFGPGKSIATAGFAERPTAPEYRQGPPCLNRGRSRPETHSSGGVRELRIVSPTLVPRAGAGPRSNRMAACMCIRRNQPPLRRCAEYFNFSAVQQFGSGRRRQRRALCGHHNLLD